MASRLDSAASACSTATQQAGRKSGLWASGCSMAARRCPTCAWSRVVSASSINALSRSRFIGASARESRVPRSWCSKCRLSSRLHCPSLRALQQLRIELLNITSPTLPRLFTESNRCAGGLHRATLLSKPCRATRRTGDELKGMEDVRRRSTTAKAAAHFAPRNADSTRARASCHAAPTHGGEGDNSLTRSPCGRHTRNPNTTPTEGARQKRQDFTLPLEPVDCGTATAGAA